MDSPVRRRSRASAPTGRDSIAQGGAPTDRLVALGGRVNNFDAAPRGRDSFVCRMISALRESRPVGALSRLWPNPGLAPWVIESRPDWGSCRHLIRPLPHVAELKL